jgi:hypothetical protein
VTQPASRRGPGRGASSLKVWGLCAGAGLLLISLAVVLTVDRDSPRRSGHAIPLVNIGQLDSAPPPRHVNSTQQSAQPRGKPIPAGSRLRLSRLDLDAPITHVGVMDNVMQIPRDPQLLGWWTGGAAPGDAQGTTVIVGHINFAGVDGALAVLPQARPGDTVVLSEAHHDLRYRVFAIRSYPKSVGLPTDVFTRAGSPRLALITCGGEFNAATGNYEDNIVAYAQPG